MTTPTRTPIPRPSTSPGSRTSPRRRPAPSTRTSCTASVLRPPRPSPARCGASVVFSPVDCRTRVSTRERTEEWPGPDGREIRGAVVAWVARLDRSAARGGRVPDRGGDRLRQRRPGRGVHRRVLPRLRDRRPRRHAPIGLRGRGPTPHHPDGAGPGRLCDRRGRGGGRPVLADPNHLDRAATGHPVPTDAHPLSRGGGDRARARVRPGTSPRPAGYPRTARRPGARPPLTGPGCRGAERLWRAGQDLTVSRNSRGSENVMVSSAVFTVETSSYP